MKWLWQLGFAKFRCFFVGNEVRFSFLPRLLRFPLVLSVGRVLHHRAITVYTPITVENLGIAAPATSFLQKLHYN